MIGYFIDWIYGLMIILLMYRDRYIMEELNRVVTVNKLHWSEPDIDKRKKAPSMETVHSIINGTYITQTGPDEYNEVMRETLNNLKKVESKMDREIIVGVIAKARGLSWIKQQEDKVKALNEAFESEVDYLRSFNEEFKDDRKVDT